MSEVRPTTPDDISRPEVTTELARPETKSAIRNLLERKTAGQRYLHLGFTRLRGQDLWVPFKPGTSLSVSYSPAGKRAPYSDYDGAEEIGGILKRVVHPDGRREELPYKLISSFNQTTEIVGPDPTSFVGEEEAAQLAAELRRARPYPRRPRLQGLVRLITRQ